MKTRSSNNHSAKRPVRFKKACKGSGASKTFKSRLMDKTTQLLGLDVGGARIGVALGDSGVRIAVPYGAIDVDGSEVKQIMELVIANSIDIVVVGYPRNQSGEATA